MAEMKSRIRMMQEKITLQRSTMVQLETQSKEAMFTKERMTGDATAKSQKLNHMAQERMRLLSEVDRLTGEREVILKNRESYDSQEHELRG